MVNKPPTSSSNSNQQLATNPPPVSIDALKRKFQRVNQEIVKQNVLLQEQAARIRQENHRLLQENVRVKSRAVALESKLREAEGVCSETKKSIADRIEILEAIGEHLISVTKFLRILSFDEKKEKDKENTEPNTFGFSAVSPDNLELPNKSNKKKQNRPNKSSKLAALDSIAEEQDLKEITSEIGDVSLKDFIEDEDESNAADNKRKRK